MTRLMSFADDGPKISAMGDDWDLATTWRMGDGAGDRIAAAPPLPPSIDSRSRVLLNPVAGSIDDPVLCWFARVETA